MDLLCSDRKGLRKYKITYSFKHLKLFRENIFTRHRRERKKKFRNKYQFNLKQKERALETAIHFIRGELVEIYIAAHKSQTSVPAFPTAGEKQRLLSLGFTLSA